jgi:glycine betaine catabolism B
MESATQPEQLELQLIIREKRDEAKGTKTFIFDKPQGFQYDAGQYGYWTLNELKFPEARGPMRHFTISSSPTEDFLSITVRIRPDSGYKQTLDSLQVGDSINFRGPNGTFALNDDHLPEQQVLIAGGIGITPFRSMIKYVADKSLQIPIHLIYSNSLPEEIAFRKEFEQISALHQNIKISMTVTKPEESQEQWQGLIGRIDENLISKLTTNYQSPTFWLCGPPPMVTAMEETLEKLQIPQEKIKVEKMTGY